MTLPFIEIIEAVTPDPNLLMWKFTDADKEIKNGARLTVRESQHAMLLNEGQLADIFSPGLYTLKTENIPVLSRLKGWKYGFESPFKADVYFFNTHQFIDLKWGTPVPVILSDSAFGQVRVRAFGAYNIYISDVATFFRQYAGTYPQLTIHELSFQLRDFIAPHFAEVLAQSGISVMEVAGNTTALSQKIQPLLQPFFTELGLTLTRFQVTSVTLPDEVTAHLDKMTNINMVSDMNKYQQFTTVNAMAQQGTALNEGLQQGAVMTTMLQALNQQPAQPAPTAPAEDELTIKLKKLKALFDGGLIDEAEYKSKKAELIHTL